MPPCAYPLPHRGCGLVVPLLSLAPAPEGWDKGIKVNTNCTECITASSTSSSCIILAHLPLHHPDTINLSCSSLVYVCPIVLLGFGISRPRPRPRRVGLEILTQPQRTHTHHSHHHLNLFSLGGVHLSYISLLPDTLAVQWLQFLLVVVPRSCIDLALAPGPGGLG